MGKSLLTLQASFSLLYLFSHAVRATRHCFAVSRGVVTGGISWLPQLFLIFDHICFDHFTEFAEIWSNCLIFLFSRCCQALWGVWRRQHRLYYPAQRSSRYRFIIGLTNSGCFGQYYLQTCSRGVRWVCRSTKGFKPLYSSSLEVKPVISVSQSMFLRQPFIPLNHSYHSTIHQ